MALPTDVEIRKAARRGDALALEEMALQWRQAALENEKALLAENDDAVRLANALLMGEGAVRMLQNKIAHALESLPNSFAGRARDILEGKP